MRTRILFFFLLFTASLAVAQKENRLLRQGNRNFEKGDFKEAEKDYRKALELNRESGRGQFNLGTAVYKNNNFEEATKIYSGMADRKAGKEMQSKVLHNLGNSLLQSKEYEKSIQAYKNALKNDPKNLDTKYNLEYAKMMLKKQQQQQQQQQQNQDKKDDQKDQQDKQQQQNDQQKQQNDQQKQPQDQRKISKEDAERMLEALKNDEKRTMQKVKKQKAKVQVVGIEKDW